MEKEKVTFSFVCKGNICFIIFAVIFKAAEAEKLIDRVGIIQYIINMGKIVISICLLATVIMFAGCKKGDTGPQGPTGNANVVSAVYKVDTWSSSTANSIDYVQATIDDASITADIVDNGLVLVYECSDIQNPDWLALPFTEPTGQNNITTSFNFTHSDGEVVIIINNSDGSDPGNQGTLYFKIIAISGTAMAAHPKVNLKNYEEVITTFNIKNQNQFE